MHAEAMKQEAMAAAVRWARWRMGPTGFRELITHADVEMLRYGRLITRYAVRTGSWAEEPFRGGTVPPGFPLELESLDLWSGTPEELAARTSHPVGCRRCSGDGLVTCPSCHGTLRAKCAGCGGTGKRMSRARKNYRMVNCQQCRGNGQKKCVRCSKGQVGCSPCQGSGRMRRWLKVATVHHAHVGIWPDDPWLSAHPGLKQGSPHAAQWQGARTVASWEHAGRIPPSQLGPEAEALGFFPARASLEPGLEPLRTRVLSQRLEVFEAPVATVHYAFAGKKGFLKLLGSGFRPTPVRDTRPFRHRFACLLGVFFVSLFGAVFLTGAFTERQLFYGRHPAAGLVALASLGFVPGFGLMTASWLRRRRPDGSMLAKRWQDRLGFGLAGPCALAVLACFLFVRPSVQELSRLTAAGQLEQAELHASALQGEGNTSAAFIDARNAFVRARILEMDNRDAVRFIEPYVRTKEGTEPLEAERRRLREAWVAKALSQNEEAEAEKELTALTDEGAPAALVDGLRARLEDQRIEQGKALLAKGEEEEAIRTLLRIRTPGLASEPPGLLLSQAYLLRAQACSVQELHCRAQALKLAAEAGPMEAARNALAAFRSEEINRLAKAVRASGGVSHTLRALQEGERDAGILLSVFEGDAELTGVREGLLRRREELLRKHWPLGEPVEVVQALLGPSGLEERRPGVFAVRQVPPGTLVHLFVSQGLTRGVHVTAREHGREALATEALQQVAQLLAGKTFAAKDLARAGKGVAHVPARLGGHVALLGWQDGMLVEALLGKVEP
ncbi:hypothetical protein SAMN05443639_112131 [Stigmatella erecta]|uniref:CR-type domain-containing protein n=1 Tax=Stigmatella erecta TaxID=83460 RepID=A0A1I0KPY5_9BACT|nr:hypothetical protein SAMN05443639_112131 [Stigmatella erecta]